MHARMRAPGFAIVPMLTATSTSLHSLAVLEVLTVGVAPSPDSSCERLLCFPCCRRRRCVVPAVIFRLLLGLAPPCALPDRSDRGPAGLLLSSAAQSILKLFQPPHARLRADARCTCLQPTQFLRGSSNAPANNTIDCDCMLCYKNDVHPSCPQIH
eukprot:6213332-Pleurochrysis_carterae.AAC.1